MYHFNYLSHSIKSSSHPSSHKYSHKKTPIQCPLQIPFQPHHIFPRIHIIPFIYERYRQSHTCCSFQSRPRHLCRTPWYVPEQFRNMASKPDQVISSVQTRADHGICFIKTFQTVIDIPGWQVWTITIQNNHFFISLLKKRSRYICQPWFFGIFACVKRRYLKSIQLRDFLLVV